MLLLSLAKYAAIPPSALTPAIIAEIGGALGVSIDPTDELTQQVVQLLSEEKIDQLSDLLGRQDVFPKVAALMAPPSNNPVEIIDFDELGDSE